jgi:dihydroflavonol-4-reductase
VFSYFGQSAQDMQTTAQLGGLYTVEAAKEAGVKQFILTSSAVVLGGNSKPVALNEISQLSARDVPDYFTTKVLQEQVALQRAKELKLELIIANPTAFIGPNDFRPSASLATITSYIADPFKMTYPGGINIVHVDDVAAGHLLLSEQGIPYERHLMGAENWDFPKIHRCIAELCGIRAPRFQVNRSIAYLGAMLMELAAKITRTTPLATRALANQVGRYFWVDDGKARKLGYTSRPTRQTLAETIAWLIDSPHLTEAQRKALKPASEVLLLKLKAA